MPPASPAEAICERLRSDVLLAEEVSDGLRLRLRLARDGIELP